MVHVRLNARDSNPNTHINFITHLPYPGAQSPYAEDDALQLLRALAAQVRPIMRDHGFEVNSFEEYEYNAVFAGRNWNAGETVELVLRRPDGSFVPNAWLLSTLCHELAHIKHMNHGPAFQRLWAQLRREVRDLQARGYYGDGYWSPGTRLIDSQVVGGDGIGGDDFLPEYVCGGAQTRSRPKTLGRRRRRRTNKPFAGPSLHTGAQTERRRKPGARIAGDFGGSGVALNEDIADSDAKAKGTGFRKHAGSKRAREERALAAEKRLRALQGTAVPTASKSKLEGSNQGHPSTRPSLEDIDAGFSSEDEGEDEDENDETRRKLLRDVTSGNGKDKNEGEDMNSMRAFMREFLAESSRSSTAGAGLAKGKERASTSASASGTGCGTSSRAVVGASASTSAHASDDVIVLSDGDDDDESEDEGDAIDAGDAVKDENWPPPRGRTFGTPKSKPKPTSASTSASVFASPSSTSHTHKHPNPRPSESEGRSSDRPSSARANATASSTAHDRDSDDGDGRPWNCLVCTLENRLLYLVCAACSTPRGEEVYVS